MATSLTHTTELVISTCWCGMPHAVPRELREHQQRQHRDGRKQDDIYCPLGHAYVIAGKGEAAALRDQLERERQAKVRLRAEKDQVEASLRATKGALTKAKRRATNGVCPCCKRTFVNVQRHMASKHPDEIVDLP